MRAIEEGRRGGEMRGGEQTELYSSIKTIKTERERTKTFSKQRNHQIPKKDNDCREYLFNEESIQIISGAGINHSLLYKLDTKVLIQSKLHP